MYNFASRVTVTPLRRKFLGEPYVRRNYFCGSRKTAKILHHTYLTIGRKKDRLPNE